MESQTDQASKGQRIVELRATVDAPAGNCQRRTATGPPAASKLVRKTFLVDHTQSNVPTHLSGGPTWSVKIHDLGKQWVEASWGKVDPHPGKKGFRERRRTKN